MQRGVDATHWGERSEETDRMLDMLEAHVRPRVEATEILTVICSHHGVDAKQALEVGFGLMLGKRILLIVEPGVVLPEKLAEIADETVFHDWKEHPKGLPAAVLAACDRMAARGLI